MASIALPVLIALAMLSCSSAYQFPAAKKASRVPEPQLRPVSKPSGSALMPAAVAIPALTIPAPAFADFWSELNDPPITLNPFEIHPAGYLFLGAYACYLGWQVFGPSSKAEQEWAEKVRADMDVAKAAAPAFLESAASAEGARVLASGVVYQELVVGEGVMPSDTEQTVKVHYTGTLHDGTKFDSSLDRGEPTSFKVGQVIKGWQEGLSLMKTGGKAILTIPSPLAYGDMPVGSIPAGSALRFEVELLEVTEPKQGLFGFGGN